MDDTLNGDNKRKSNQGEEDTEKRYKPVDSRDEMLQVMIAAVEQMRQTQQQTVAVMGELLQHMKSTSSTANTASPATDQLVATHEQQAIAEMIQAVTQASTLARAAPKAKVPEEVKQGITKFMKRTSDRISKNIKACKRLEIAKADLKEMDTAGRYPAGTRPFKSQVDMAELDQLHEECAHQDHTFTVTIPARSTRREVFATIHHNLTKECKRINTIAMDERVGKEKAMLKRCQIMQDCQAVIDKILDVDSLGLDDPIQQQSFDDAIEALKEEEYGKIIQEVRKKEQKAKEEAEK